MHDIAAISGRIFVQTRQILAYIRGVIIFTRRPSIRLARRRKTSRKVSKSTVRKAARPAATRRNASGGSTSVSAAAMVGSVPSGAQ